MNTPGWSKRRLSRRQRRFAHEYVAVGFNGCEAARRAGYAPGSIANVATRLLAWPEIREIVDEACRSLACSTTIRAELTVAELQAIAHANIADYLIVDSPGALPRWKEPAALTREQHMAIKRIEYRDGKIRHIEFYDKLEALEKLCRLSASFPKADAVNDDWANDPIFAAMLSPIDSESLGVSARTRN